MVPGVPKNARPPIPAETLRELAHGEVLALGQLDHPLATALARVGLGDLGQRSVCIEPGGINRLARASRSMT
jgi:hypothetical protein